MQEARVQEVTAAVVLRGERVLIARRPAGPGPTAGRWEFPGGKIERGETPEQCLRREIREEFGVDSRVGPFLGANVFAYPNVTVRLLAYRAELAGEPEALNAHDRAEWVGLADLGAYEFTPADVPFVERLRRHGAERWPE